MTTLNFTIHLTQCQIDPSCPRCDSPLRAVSPTDITTMTPNIMLTCDRCAHQFILEPVMHIAELKLQEATDNETP